MDVTKLTNTLPQDNFFDVEAHIRCHGAYVYGRSLGRPKERQYWDSYWMYRLCLDDGMWQRQRFSSKRCALLEFTRTGVVVGDHKVLPFDQFECVY